MLNEKTPIVIVAASPPPSPNVWEDEVTQPWIKIPQGDVIKCLSCGYWSNDQAFKYPTCPACGAMLEELSSFQKLLTSHNSLKYKLSVFYFLVPLAAFLGFVFHWAFFIDR